MFDNAGGLLQRGRQAAGGVFDNMVGLPKRFREMGNNPTLQAALQRGKGVFADIKGVGRGWPNIIIPNSEQFLVLSGDQLSSLRSTVDNKSEVSSSKNFELRIATVKAIKLYRL